MGKVNSGWYRIGKIQFQLKNPNYNGVFLPIFIFRGSFTSKYAIGIRQKKT